MTRRAAAAALLLLASATAATAGRITLATEAACAPAGEGARCEVTLANRGDEAAQELRVELELAAQPRGAESIPRLSPGETWHGRFDVPAPPPGRSVAIVHTLYHDEGGLPLSTLGHAVLERDPPPGGIAAELDVAAVDDRPAGAVLSVTNAGAATWTGSARLVLPRELLVVGAPSVSVTLAAGERRDIRFAVRNAGAFPGSSYRVYALLEAPGDSLAVPATARVVAPRRPGERARVPVLVGVVVLLGGAVAARLRDRAPAPSAPPAGRGTDRAGRLVDVLVLAGIWAWLLATFRPALLLDPTTITGGDTASHFLTARYLRDTLLPEGRVLGWMPGNLAGYPAFQLYFPLPFLLAVVGSYAVGLQVAFKLVTVLGTFALPLCAYLAFRQLGFRRPAPACAAVLTLPFLMIEANSVWGGNLLSTLAGEFSYSLGLGLTLLFAGTSYRGLVTGRGVTGNALLLAAIGLSHAYTLLLAGALSGAHLLLLPNFRQNARYLARLYLLAFCLVGFWIVPLLAYAEYTSPYRDVWRIDSWRQVVPSILWPCAGLAVGAGLAAAWRAARRGAWRTLLQPRVAVLVNALWIGLLLYRIAPRIGVVDVRFLPLVQLATALLAAAPLAALARDRASRLALPLLALAVAVPWCERQSSLVPQWIEWNYSGFERRPLWPTFAAVNAHLAGGPADPRVVFEHSPAHNAAGSIRAFESLPLFSGRSTLEGLYIQSGLLTPAIFYLQSELSEVASCPLPDWHCARLDAERAAEHLRQFNVNQVIVRSAAARQALDGSPSFAREAEFPPYTVYRVAGNEDRYVVPLDHQPVLLDGPDWKRQYFHWYKQPGASEVVLARAPDASPDELARFRLPVSDLATGPPRVPLAVAGVTVEEEIRPHSIRIRTSRPGHPLLVRVAYHPRWQAKGADRIFLASPGFMLVFPREREVTLRWGDPPLVRLGHALTAGGTLAVLAAAARAVGRRARRWRRADLAPLAPAPPGPAPSRSGLAPLALGLLALAAAAGTGSGESGFAPAHYERGLELYKAERFAAASPHFERALAANPLSSAALHASFYRALCAYRLERWAEAAALFAEALARFPESPYRAEAEYHLGLCRRRLGDAAGARLAFQGVVADFPTTPWASHAVEQLGGGRS